MSQRQNSLAQFSEFPPKGFNHRFIQPWYFHQPLFYLDHPGYLTSESVDFSTLAQGGNRSAWGNVGLFLPPGSWPVQYPKQGAYTIFHIRRNTKPCPFARPPALSPLIRLPRPGLRSPRPPSSLVVRPRRRPLHASRFCHHRQANFL